MHYEQRHGDYVLLSDTGAILVSAAEISVCFDGQSDPPVLLKHGERGRVEAYAQSLRERMNNAGLTALAQGIVVLTGAFAVEDLNRLIDTTGYLRTFLKAHELPSGRAHA